MKNKNDEKPVKAKKTLEEKQEIALAKHKERIKKSQDKVTDTSKFFCTNKTLMAELIKWRDSAEKVEDRVISEDFGKMILQIATKLTNHSSFRNYNADLKQEMISYACFKIIQGLKNYNFNFENPFAYLTQAAWNAFVSVCAKYYKQLNLKKDLIKKMSVQLETTTGVNQNKIMNSYIKKYLGEDFVDGSDE